jgi:transposase
VPNKHQQHLLLTMHALSADQKTHIISLLTSGKSAHEVSTITGHGTGTISRLHRKHCPYLPRSNGGRPRKLTDRNVQHAVRLISSGKAETAVEVTRALQDVVNGSLSPETTRRYLKQAGMKAVVKKKKPALTARHKHNRLDFALAHRDWTVEDWKKVVWSDETKINHLGSDGRKWAWKKAGEGLSDRLVQGTVKFGGGSVMVWGCMMWEGPGMACKIDGRMDGQLYVDILEDDLQASLEYYGKEPEDVIFQQDNDPKHTCKKAKKWFDDHGIEPLLWPAQSPDLNPIEHLWHHLKRRLGGYESQPNGILELWERVQDEWDKIDPKVCQDLIESMPRRVQAVIDAKGGSTKY